MTRTINVVLHGNIGAGKSTTIKRIRELNDDNVITMPESSADWYSLLKKVYSNEPMGLGAKSEAAKDLQMLVMDHFKLHYEIASRVDKDAGKIIYMERSMWDATNIFIPLNRPLLCYRDTCMDRIKEHAYKSKLMGHNEFDTCGSKKHTWCSPGGQSLHIFLSVPLPIVMERVSKRNDIPIPGMYLAMVEALHLDFKGSYDIIFHGNGYHSDDIHDVVQRYQKILSNPKNDSKKKAFMLRDLYGELKQQLEARSASFNYVDLDEEAVVVNIYSF